jgi:hypothetical protein
MSDISIREAVNNGFTVDVNTRDPSTGMYDYKMYVFANKDDLIAFINKEIV